MAKSQTYTDVKYLYSNDIEFIITDYENNGVFCTPHGYSKLTGVSHEEIVRRLKSEDKFNQSVGILETGEGDKLVILIPLIDMLKNLQNDKPNVLTDMVLSNGAIDYLYNLVVGSRYRDLKIINFGGMVQHFSPNR